MVAVTETETLGPLSRPTYLAPGDADGEEVVGSCASSSVVGDRGSGGSETFGHRRGSLLPSTDSETPRWHPRHMTRVTECPQGILPYVEASCLSGRRQETDSLPLSVARLLRLLDSSLGAHTITSTTQHTTTSTTQMLWTPPVSEKE